MRTSLLDHIVSQLVRRRRCSRKVCGKQFADFVNRLDQSVAKLLILKMGPHSVHNALPKFVAAFLVNRFVADYGELVRAWRYKNQNRIALPLRMHTQLMKFFLRSD